MTTNAPQITQTGGVVSVYLPGFGLKGIFSRWSTSSRHETTAELELRWWDAVVDKGFITLTRINMVSLEAERRVGRALDDREGERGGLDFKYASILPEMCVMALRKHREGEPSVEISAMPQPEDDQWLVYPWLTEKEHTVLFGDGDTGKSWIAYLCATVGASGRPLAGIMAAKPFRSLILDYETNAATVWRRLNKVTAGEQMAIPDGIHHMRMSQMLEADIDRVAAEVQRVGADLVIIDSAAPATRSPESSETVPAFFAALNGLGVSVLTIAHVPKNNPDPRYPFGSTFWRNLPRANWRTFREPMATGELLVGLRHTKGNNSRTYPDMAISFQFDDDVDEVRIARADPMDIQTFKEKPQGANVGQQVRDALRSGAKSYAQLSEHLDGMNASSIRGAVQRARDIIEVGHDPASGDKLWGLVAQ